MTSIASSRAPADFTRIAIIGAGSFVFGPAMLRQALVEHRFSKVELALVDPDTEMVELMAAAGRHIAKACGCEVRVTAHTDRTTALPGATHVICAAAIQIHKRFSMDVAAIHAHAPGHLVTEFGGVAGLSYTLRQIELVTGVARDMLRLCPEAWLLDSANPMPRVSQAAHETGIRTAGFCSASMEVFMQLARILDDAQVTHADYPWTAIAQQYQPTLAGLNHFCWLVGLTDRATGVDLLPRLRERLAKGGTAGNPIGEAVYREVGYLLTPNDRHIMDFLKPTPEALANPRREPSHGSSDKRGERLALLREIVAERTEWESLLTAPSWERPMDFVAAQLTGKPQRLHSLNLINAGQVPELPSDVFVETAATVTAAGPVPDTVNLPESVVPLCQRTAAVTHAMVRGAMSRKRALLEDALALDPTVTDQGRCSLALDACLKAHADILPRYA